MGLRLFFLPNFPGTMFIQGATFIPDSRVVRKLSFHYIREKLLRQLFENFYILQTQKRIVSAETVRGNTVSYILLTLNLISMLL